MAESAQHDLLSRSLEAVDLLVKSIIRRERETAEKLERLRHAVRDAEIHSWDAGSIIRVTEAAK